MQTSVLYLVSKISAVSNADLTMEAAAKSFFSSSHFAVAGQCNAMAKDRDLND